MDCNCVDCPTDDICIDCTANKFKYLYSLRNWLNLHRLQNLHMCVLIAQMEFLAFECIRNSLKWDISVALEQWRLELVQSKCIMGCQGGLYHSFVSRGVVILGRHLFWPWVFSCFVFLIFVVVVVWKFIPKCYVLSANACRYAWVL